MRLTHFKQLAHYIDNAERDGFYYGNREQFVKRHELLKQWCKAIIDYASSPDVIIPKQKLKQPID